MLQYLSLLFSNSFWREFQCMPSKNQLNAVKEIYNLTVVVAHYSCSFCPTSILLPLPYVSVQEEKLKDQNISCIL